MSFIESWKQVERAGVPIAAVTTADQPAIMRTMSAYANGSKSLLVHDVTRGLTAPREADKNLLAKVVGSNDPISFDPVTAVQAFAAKATPGACLIMVAGDRNLERPESGIALMLARDELAAKGVRVLLLCTLWKSPAELGSDVFVIDDPLPDEPERMRLITAIEDSTRRSAPDFKLTEDDRRYLVRYTRGLSAFSTQQTAATSLRKSGVDRAVAKNVWAQQIGSVKGLRVEADPEFASFDSICGNDNLKTFAVRRMNCVGGYDAILWLDEFEKLFGNSDLSGASDIVLKKLLTKFEACKWQGMIIIGPPGTGKSMAATTFGAAAGIPTLGFTPEDAKGGLVGDTERDTARMLDTVSAMGGRIYVIATSNNMTKVPDALTRRFTDNVWFQDMPTRAERVQGWRMYKAIYKLDGPGNEIPVDDRGFTLADIRNVCRSAMELSMTVSEVMVNYMPSSRAAADRIETLRRAAVGNFLSTSYPGPYRMPGDEPTPTESTTRQITVGE
jgi:hypothetical protein